MKTTVELSDALMAQARKIAAREGVTLRTLIEQGLRHALGQRAQHGQFRLRKATFKGRGLGATARGADWERLRELAYEGRRMIAVDTNVLVHAHREDSEWHQAAYQRLTEVAEGRAAWAIPWPCIHEFLAIVTHPKIFAPPTPLAKALDQVDAWMESPSLVLLAESEAHWPRLRSLLLAGKVAGPKVHDARIAALCLQHGVTLLWSADRDFGRFSDVTVANPLIA